MRASALLGAFLFLPVACNDAGSDRCPAGSSCAGEDAGNDSGGAGGNGGPGGGSGPDLGPLAGSSSNAAGESGCIDEKVEFDTQLPNVMLLVDLSGSMILPDISGGSRWEALEQALFGTEGMVPQLEAEMRFGLTLYTSATSAESPECPYLREAPLALDNAAALAEVFRSETPRGTTPTGQSLDHTWKSLAALPASDFVGPRIIVLATDGEPTLCGATDQPEAARQLAAGAVQEAFANGVTTFALALGNELGEDHLRELANLGQGFPATDSTDRSYRALDVAGLADAFRAIAMRARSCVFDLHGVVQAGEAPRGTVVLDGEPLAYEGSDGWVLVTPGQLALQGGACEAIRGGASSLDIRFPCGTVVPK